MTDKNQHIVFTGVAVLTFPFSKFSLIILTVIILLLIALKIIGYIREKKEYEEWVKNRYKDQQRKHFRRFKNDKYRED